MSRLHDPGPGEILDRLSILQLKLVEGFLRKMPVTHWASEYVALAEKQPVNEYLLELAAVNAFLWQAEDRIRELRPRQEAPPPYDPVKEAEQLAFRIATLNDRRAELVARINRDAGVQRHPEKL